MGALKTSSISPETLIQRTEAMLPAIAARAFEAERDRRIPQATIDEIKAAGLNRLMQPAQWGGFGFDFDTLFEVGWRLASACGSTGWVYAVTQVQLWQVGNAPESGQADFFDGGDVFSCCGFNPRGAQVEPAEGGWYVTGRWQFASGCLHADWALLGAFVPEFAAPTMLLVPKRDYRIDDTWHVSGLRATGSNDIVIDEPVFVPSDHCVPPGGINRSPGSSRRNGSYGAPGPSVTPWGVVIPVVGMAQGILDAYEQATRARLTAFGGKPVAQMVGPQIRVSEAAARIDAARALARNDIREIIERGATGQPFSVDERVRLRRDHAYIVNLCYEAAMLIARAGGATSLFETNPIQRFMRDVHAASMQVASGWDEQAESYGRVRLGLEPNGMMW